MQQQPPIIQYIVLLGNREQMPLTNIPPSTVVHPLLRHFGNLPRTSYIQSLVTEAKDENKGKINEKDLMDLINLTTNSMLFRNRKQIYMKLNDTNLARRMGVDFNNVIPHYLMYSTLGRADLIRFESDMKRVDELNIQNNCQ